MIDGGMRSVCAPCSNDTPRAYDSGRGYEPPGGLSVVATRAGIERMAKSVDAQSGNANRSPMLARSPGFLLVRVSIKDRDGKTRDVREAKRSLRGEKWYAELRHLGSTTLQNGVGYHLFERPPTAKLKHEIAPTRPDRSAP